MEEGLERILYDEIRDQNEPNIENTANIDQLQLKRIL